MSYRIAVDTGGTFSDVVVADAAGGELWVSKAPTTPDRVFDGISEALAYGASEHGLTFEQLLDQTSVFIYGTTRATNAILTGSTARTAFLTTEGHPDTLVLREGGKLNPFDFRHQYPAPYVPRRLTFEIPERVNSEGEVDGDAGRPWTDPTAGLASGDADVALLRLPFPGQDSLRTEMLFTEPRWVVLPATHPLAGRDVIPFRDLWDEPFVAAPAETGWWRDWWLAAGEREGHPVRIGAVTETSQPDDWLTAIANGYGVALAPESGARYYDRPGITYRPVTGISPSQVGVAWPPDADTNPVIQDFIRCCLDNKPPQSPQVPDADRSMG